jgi:4-oxalocrotonate tautomerase
MPVLNYHLVEDQYTPAQHERLLLESSRFFAEVLKCPIDRVRVFINLHRPELFAVGGHLVINTGARAPYFTFVVLEGRSLEDRQKLLTGFTDIVVEVLGVDRGLVRGGIVPVAPENWAIGGEPASRKRADEVRARAEAATRPCGG